MVQSLFEFDIIDPFLLLEIMLEVHVYWLWSLRSVNLLGQE